MPAQTPAADNNNTSSAAGATKSSSSVVGSTTNSNFTNSTASADNRAMETSEKRNNAVPKQKNMEAEAAIKIQAGFRGYQVRKQLKNKSNGAQSDPDDLVVADNQTEMRTSDVTLAKDRIPDDVQSQLAKQWKNGSAEEVTEDIKLGGSKTGAPGDSVVSSNQRRSSRRKSNTKTKPVEIEEKSAVKIQAGVRGFLVRRRQQKKQKQPKE